ncbi:MAG: polysaccharide biosynthesis protein [Peptococcia bacterium]
MAKQTFLQGAFILVITSIIVKALGFLYQIIVVRMIGTEGIGVYNMVYPLYTTVLLLATAGIPTAIVKFVAEDTARKNTQSVSGIMGMAIAIVLITSTISSLFLIFVSPALIRKFYTDPRVIPAFLIMIPTLLMVAVSSCLKGYFQGLQDMRPTANNQLIEQAIRFSSGLLLVYLLHPYGLTWATVGLSLGVLLSEAGGLLYIWHLYTHRFQHPNLLKRPNSPTVKKLCTFGIPITLTRITGTISYAAEASLIPRQLIRSGTTLTQATSLFGELTGITFTLISIPSTLTFSLATTLVPAIAESFSNKQKKALAERTGAAIGVTLWAGIPCAIILYFWGQELTYLLFNVPNAGTLLRYLAPVSVFLYLCQTCSGILQGTGYVKTVFVISFISNLLRLTGIFIFGGRPGAGLEGIVFSYIVSFIFSAVLNLIIVKRVTGFKPDYGFGLRLLLGGILLCQLLKITKGLIQGNIIYLTALILLNVLLFFIFLYVSGDKYTRLVLDQIIKRKT